MSVSQVIELLTSLFWMLSTPMISSCDNKMVDMRSTSAFKLDLSLDFLTGLLTANNELQLINTEQPLQKKTIENRHLIRPVATMSRKKKKKKKKGKKKETRNSTACCRELKGATRRPLID
ncbi:hypothetical protein E6O75_ATG02841 [Venturia nashicola]|uniref:Uncharacterized protein n=1 Tax=Venturia nashicola TaxID=86259 RepID=A0A4Z1PGS8_9PEZI|nr:hypothetical protein E6O75_ATG02841 [Venturia nashicola]